MLGMMVFVLVWVRLVARQLAPSPRIEPATPAWQALLAKLVHMALYLLMIGLPLLGWLMLSAAGKPIPFFGLQLPALIGENKELAKQLKEIHEVAATAGYYLIGVRAAAALHCNDPAALAQALRTETEQSVRGAIAASLGKVAATTPDAVLARIILSAPECSDDVRAQVALHAEEEERRRVALDPEVRGEAERAHAVDESEIDHLRVAPLLARDLAHRHAEPHLAPHPDFIRQQIAERPPQDPLALAPAVFPRHRKRRRQLDQAIIEERLPALQRVGHRRDVDLGHQVARQVGDQIRQRERRDRIAGAGETVEVRGADGRNQVIYVRLADLERVRAHVEAYRRYRRGLSRLRGLAKEILEGLDRLAEDLELPPKP